MSAFLISIHLVISRHPARDDMILEEQKPAVNQKNATHRPTSGLSLGGEFRSMQCQQRNGNCRSSFPCSGIWNEWICASPIMSDVSETVSKKKTAMATRSGIAHSGHETIGWVGLPENVAMQSRCPATVAILFSPSARSCARRSQGKPVADAQFSDLDRAATPATERAIPTFSESQREP